LQPAPPSRYPTASARRADLVVQGAAVGVAAVGGIALVALAVCAGSAGLVASVSVYAAALLVMLGASAAYALAGDGGPLWLRRLDHAGIFLAIAGSYTPFTTQVLTGAWAWGMTAAVWSLALTGAGGKLLLKGVEGKVWIPLYLALGWIVIVALKPLRGALEWTTLTLLAGGGVIYSVGVLFHVARRLTFSRAIWHGHVAAAATTHWAAVLTGVVLTR
jgi:hemolysin III